MYIVYVCIKFFNVTNRAKLKTWLQPCLLVYLELLVRSSPLSVSIRLVTYIAIKMLIKANKLITMLQKISASNNVKLELMYSKSPYIKPTFFRARLKKVLIQRY